MPAFLKAIISKTVVAGQRLALLADHGAMMSSGLGICLVAVQSKSVSGSPGSRRALPGGAKASDCAKAVRSSAGGVDLASCSRPVLGREYRGMVTSETRNWYMGHVQSEHVCICRRSTVAWVVLFILCTRQHSHGTRTGQSVSLLLNCISHEARVARLTRCSCCCPWSLACWRYHRASTALR